LRKTALVVDDSKTARLVLQKILEMHDLEVATAESAEDAIAYLSEFRPDIIFMDHEMPGMDGFEAVSAIKNNPATATIPIMMYTAQQGELFVGQARALGAIGVLPKQLEPVEVSKVLASLRIIGEDAELRERHDAAAVHEHSGHYPSLDSFDRDLRVMIQDLFDQQRAILRRELRDSHEKMASRLADEIRPPGSKPPGGERNVSRFLRENPAWAIAAMLAVVVVALAGLYMDREGSRRTLQAQNDELQRALSARQAPVASGTDDTRQALDYYRQSLLTARGVALDSLEWAANQSSQYGLDDIPMGDFRLAVMQKLSAQLLALGFRGLVRIESHVGNFCMTLAGTGAYEPAPADLPASRCDQIGFAPDEAYSLGMRQSVGFANYINSAGTRTGGAIRYEIISHGNSSPLLNYPASPEGFTAGAWNEVAANNNRVEISLLPDAQ